RASPDAVDNASSANPGAPHLGDVTRHTARRTYGLSPDDFVVLFAGKVNGGKRPIDAVEALGRLGAPYVLLVAGDGELAAEMRVHAERVGARVAWAGFVNQRELGRAYAASDCLVVPSLLETWGLVVNEG